MRTTDSGKSLNRQKLRKARLILEKGLKRVLEINKQLKYAASEANVKLQENLRSELKLLNRIIEQQARLVKAYELALGQF
ncbi:MAG: hypothetical protein AAGI49_01755 [Bacteroidota bacterium]